MSIQQFDSEGLFYISIDEDEALLNDLVRIDNFSEDIILCDDIIDILETHEMDCFVTYDSYESLVYLEFYNPNDRAVVYNGIINLLGY